MDTLKDFINLDNKKPLIIAGPCQLETPEINFAIAKTLKKISIDLDINIVFKASYDKANRTSISSPRGIGIKKGLEVLKEIGETYKLPLLTDIHEANQAEEVGKVVDILQIPAFLCRQTDLIVAASKTGKIVNIKKGQFMAPLDMVHSINKVKESGNSKVVLTERGTSFGYNNLIVDMRSLPLMSSLKVPVIFDATHSVQKPSANGGTSSGDRSMIAPLSRAAAGIGVDGFFFEVHPEPNKALSDADNTYPLNEFKNLLETLIKIDKITREVK